jgi:methyl-accepting chemotaxis protein
LALKSGELTHRIGEEFPGKYQRLRDDFNAMIEALEDQIWRKSRRLLTTVRAGASEISAAAGFGCAYRAAGNHSGRKRPLTVMALTESVTNARAAAVVAAQAAREAEKEATNSGRQMVMR